MKPYADTNLFTRLYLPLEESPEADELANQARLGLAEPVPVHWLHRVEISNAFQLHVYQGARPGHVRVTPEQASVAWEMFLEDVAQGTYLAAIELPETQLVEEFTRLSQRFTALHGFRAYDLLHVAAARLLDCDTFWSFDLRARKLASLAEMAVFPRARQLRD